MERIRSLASAVTRVALLSGALLSASVPALAAPVPSWDWTNTVVIDTASVTFTAGSGCTSVSTSAISWGSCTDPAERSLVEILFSPAIAPPAAALITSNGPVASVDFRHDNNTISSTFKVLSSGVFDSQMTLTPTLGGPPVVLPVASFPIHFTETLNAGPCPIGSPPCADIFTVPLAALTIEFPYVDGLTYALSFSFAGLGPLPLAACDAAGAPFPCVGIVTAENTDNIVHTFWEIHQVVPEPATLLLLGAGLLGLGLTGWSRSRRKSLKAL